MGVAPGIKRYINEVVSSLPTQETWEQTALQFQDHPLDSKKYQDYVIDLLQASDG